MTSINDSKKIPNDLKETIQNYKGQVGRYNKIVMSDEWDEKTELMTQAVLVEHKKKLIQANQGTITKLTTTNIDGFDYINSITFKMEPESSEVVKFYKADTTKNYTYPINNNTSIITVEFIDWT